MNSVHSLLDNAAILVASTIIYQVSVHYKETRNRSSELFDAFLFGLIGILIMAIPYQAFPGILIDTRSILIGAVTLIFSLRSSLLLTTMLVAYRLYLGGVGMLYGVALIVASFLIALAFKRFKKPRSLPIVYLYGLFLHTLVYASLALLKMVDPSYLQQQLFVPLVLVLPIVTVVVTKLFDIQSSRLEQHRLTQRAEAYHRSIFEQATIGICYFDRYGTITYANPFMAKLFKAKQSHLEGESLRTLNIHREKDLPYGLDFSIVQDRSNSVTLEKQLQRLDGSQFWANISFSAIQFDEEELFMSTIIDISDRKEAEAMMAYLNDHDQLTGCKNRYFFENHLIFFEASENWPNAFVIVDVNGLKLFNDAFGFEHGNVMIKSVANILIKNTPDNGHTIRYGGSEFLVALPQHDLFKTLAWIRNIKDQIAEFNMNDVQISVSTGYALMENDHQSIAQLLVKAEERLNREKLSDSTSVMSHTIEIIMNSLYAKNKREMEHSKRVSDLCEKMAIRLRLDSTLIQKLKVAGLMHDIGKIGIPDAILDKPGKLDDNEFILIQKHAESGYKILSAANEFSEIANYILAHHERWDGKGYPKGLKETEIPIYARIISIADAYDAMTSDRAYRKGLSVDAAMSELQKHSGRQFDPYLVKIFTEMLGKDKSNPSEKFS